ncbi:sulfatase-like hydrolase/transferase [Paenibacillus aceris]|uniref:Arylsulfatase A-like enzyme n=1 Tax=Paenibacillus aceris TaxID=869555 RepID=A0ABS4HQE2_9BACL|nr:sulfatase-like hydrolase/transferase [Paenibacillus aceris]MBP1960820.1 arylsulfatase A-like enzyme [Paenibacillus aceris]NHW35501.1 sulfatase-like hydrolase/transferase [Paenibacillus aceris]
MKKKPNILFMIADDHRFDAIRSFGDTTVQTPVLDGLAAQGVSFSRNHMMGGLSGAVCVPARSCVHTGVNVLRACKNPDMNDMPGMMTLNPEVAHLPETFKHAGYHTYATGKWHNDKKSFANGFCGGANIFFGGMSDHNRVPVQDFDPNGVYPKEAEYFGESFSTELFSNSAIRFLETYDREEPFFLYLAYTAPHDPRTAPEAYADMYHPADIPLPVNYMEQHPFDNGELHVRDEKLEQSPRTPDAIRQHIADYYAMITHLDHNIGKVLETLSSSGYAEDTIIVYTADHGLALGQHGLLGKQNLYDHSIRIPLIISGPGLPAGKQVQALTYTYDLFPTLCNLTGIDVPLTVESRSLAPLIYGETEKHREFVCAIYKDLQRTVSNGEWKLIRYYRSGGGGAGSDKMQLFNLTEDPWELRDLSGQSEYSGKVGDLSRVLNEWQTSIGDSLANALDIKP